MALEDCFIRSALAGKVFLDNPLQLCCTPHRLTCIFDDLNVTIMLRNEFLQLLHWLTVIFLPCVTCRRVFFGRPQWIKLCPEIAITPRFQPLPFCIPRSHTVHSVRC